jgi:uncharacterized protein with PIN domain
MAWFGEQYSIGDQTVETRQKFMRSHFKVCPICSSQNITLLKHDVAAVRMNGDAYGTDVYSCQKCKWLTSYEWDDSSEHYYYELK